MSSMPDLHKVAVIGDRDSVLGFKALGFLVVYADEPARAAQVINRLARERCSVIFVTERLAAGIPDTLERYKAALMPAIIPIPDSRGSTGFGIKKLSDNVEKAIGVNILRNEEGDT